MPRTDFSSLLAASDRPPVQFAELCRDDLERRWHAGERIAVDAYFEQFPTLLADTESSLLMIYSEYLLRERLGEQPSPAEFFSRFPGLVRELQTQLQLHSALGSESHPEELEASGPGSSTADRDLELFEEIGRGGMGIVLRCRDRVLDRELAVKVLRPGQFEGRFFSEARIGGRLQHPGIVPVHQFGRLADGRPFFTMKLVEGSTLAALLAERSDPHDRQAEFLRIFEKVCQTVAFAHERGVIHRDLKPANVMVGRFGEVQVMDWGLSKQLGSADPPAENLPRASPDQQSSQSASTQFGTIIGTPGYMAPEQACGARDPDARSDVFGLGGMLAEILTGQPPFAGADRAALLAQAARGDLADTRDRLDRCGADADLIALAKSCLAAARTARPGNAGEVAKAVADHAAGTEARLRQAELNRAAAEARSLSDRRARRLTAVLAVAGMAFAAIVAVGTVWYQRDRDRQYAEQQRKVAAVEQEVRLELQKAAELDLQARGLVHDPPRWEAALANALASARRASHLIDTEGIAIESELRGEVASTIALLEEDESDRQLISTLEAIRFVPDGIYDDTTAADRSHAVPQYRAAFAARGLDAPGAAIAAASEWLARRPPSVRAALTLMLDDWLSHYSYGDKDPTAVWLRDVLRAVETDPWRREIRDVRFRPSLALQDLSRLVDQADLTAHPPSAYYLLASDLSIAGDTEKAIAFLRRAQHRHPGDFSLNFFLGRMLTTLKKYPESVRYYLAARVARPNDPRLLVNLGNALYRTNDLDGALEVYRLALECDPKLAGVHIGLGMVQRAKGDANGAIEHYRTAITLAPSSPIPHYDLANALLDKGDIPAAIKSCQRALEIDPTYHPAFSSLGDALARKRDWAGALAARRRAVELNPGSGPYHYALGSALNSQNDWAGAAAAFRKATELDPTNRNAFNSLGQALFALKEWRGAAEAFRTAIERNPTNAQAHLNLGVCLRNLQDLPGSLAALNRADEIDSRSSWTHLQLAFTYRELNDAARSLAELKRAVELNPNYYDGQFALGLALFKMGQFAAAEAVFRRCLELSPGDPQAHCNLGLALRDQGQFAEGIQSLRRGHELGLKQKKWSYPSGRWLRDCEVLAELDEKLPGTADASELIALAELRARYRRRYAEAVRFTLEAFAKDPKLADGRRIEAARWAVLAANAANSQGERLSLGRQSREWLRAEIDSPVWTADSTAGLKGLLHASEFAAFRDDAYLYKIPEPERTAWRQLWDVLRHKLDSYSPTTYPR